MRGKPGCGLSLDNVNVGGMMVLIREGVEKNNMYKRPLQT